VQLAAALVHAVAGGHEEAQARGVDEAHAVQVDDQQLRLLGGHRLADDVAELRGDFEVDLALDRHHRGAAFLAGLDVEHFGLLGWLV